VKIYFNFIILENYHHIDLTGEALYAIRVRLRVPILTAHSVTRTEPEQNNIKKISPYNFSFDNGLCHPGSNYDEFGIVMGCIGAWFCYNTRIAGRNRD